VNLPAEQTAKTVVLRTPGGYRFAVMCGSDRRPAQSSGSPRCRPHQLRFASEADIATSFPAYEVGAIPPIGPDTPAELIDLRLLDYGEVLCPAGDHEHSLLVDPLVIVRATRARTVPLCQD
jgi:prolyl-tRNA editing enzyme YbaK/EbsC (Cys-tRNA(Pro) deacylase)